jgi:O-antigen/teichoic acid export membrane protein
LLKNIKTIASDTILYGLSSVLTQLVGLFLVPFYTKELSPEEYGIIALLAMVSAFLNPILALGLDSALFRYFTMGKSNYLRIRLFSSAFYIKILFVTFCVLILTLCKDPLNEYIFNNKISNEIYYLFLGSVFVQNISSLAFVILRADRKVKKIVFANISALVVSLSLSIWLVLILKIGIIGVFSAALGSSIVQATLFFVLIRSNIQFKMFGFKKIKLLFNYGIPLIPHKLIGQSLNLFVLFLINNQLGLVVAGLYAVAKKFGKPLSFIVSMVQTAWSPYKFDIHKNESNPALVFKELISFYWILLITLWSFLSLITPILFRYLIDDRYWDGIPYVPFIMLISVFEAFRFTISTGFELSKDQKKISIISFYTLLVVLGFVYLSFDYLKPYNFMIAQMLGVLFFGIYIYSEAKKIMLIQYPFKLLISLFVFSSFIILYNYLTHQSLTSVLMLSVLQLICSITVFVKLIGLNRIKKKINLKL